MNNFKKIGLTALAGSLVVTSAFAGELTASGSASMSLTNITGTADDSLGKNLSMGNSVYLAGSGELDNGLTVSLSFELDDSVDSGTLSNVPGVLRSRCPRFDIGAAIMQLFPVDCGIPRFREGLAVAKRMVS